MASDLNIGATSPTASIPTSRAVVRVAPVSPRLLTSPDGTPLDRSGLDARELFTTADELVVRAETPAVELDMGLEQARGSMVRNDPAQALAILDEVWSGAKHTETGWYLRASSLALLGLPAEAARVASDALAKVPESCANLFLLSLAKLSMGELQSAREQLATAMRKRGPDALLLVQSALLEAETGNPGEAERLLRRASAEFPDHPALTYGRRMIREVVQSSREERFALHADGGEFNRLRTPAFLRTPVSSVPIADMHDAADALPGTSGDSVPAHPEPLPNVVGDAVRRLGAALRTGTDHEAIAVAREMIASLSSGGAMAGATTASRAHVLRSLLSVIVSVLRAPGPSGSVGWMAQSVDGQWQRPAPDVDDVVRDVASGTESNSKVADTARQLVLFLREGRWNDVRQLLARAEGSVDSVALGLLRALAEDTEDAGAVGGRFAPGAPPGEREAYASERSAGHVLPQVQGQVTGNDNLPTLLAPIRLGLALLPATDLLNHALRPLSVGANGDRRGKYFEPGGFPNERAAGERESASAKQLVIAAGLFALGVLSFAFGRPLVGLALSGAGGWIALRSFPAATGRGSSG